MHVWLAQDVSYYVPKVLHQNALATVFPFPHNKQGVITGTIIMKLNSHQAAGLVEK